MSDPVAPAEFQQKLGLFDATMLVAGSMIGSGIFVVSSSIAQEVGSSGWLMLVWISAGMLTVIGALSFAELAAMMPKAGGQYIFLREAYGSLWAFLYGWTCFLVIQTGFIAAVGVVFGKYLGVLVPKLPTEGALFGMTIPVPHLVAVVLAMVLAAINTFGIEQGRWVQNLFTIAKMLGLILLIVLGLTLAANPNAVQQNLDNAWSGITETASYQKIGALVPWTPMAVVMVLSGAMVGALFSSDAWNNVTFIAGEVKNPERNLPWGLLLGTSAVAVLYVLANLAYLSALPLKGSEPPPDATNPAIIRGIDHAKDKRVGTAVLEEVSPRLGVPMMAAIIMISTFGCNNGLTIMGPRLYYAMARDGLFFQAVGKLNSHGVPAVGIWLQCAWTIVLIFSGSYDDLLDYIIFGALMFYILTVSAVFVLRRKRPDAPRPYRAWGYPVVPALYVIICAVIMLSLLVVKPVYSWPSFIIVLTGIPVYFLWRQVNKPARV